MAPQQRARNAGARDCARRLLGQRPRSQETLVYCNDVVPLTELQVAEAKLLLPPDRAYRGRGTRSGYRPCPLATAYAVNVSTSVVVKVSAVLSFRPIRA